jgi:hypothetical protein
MVILVYNKQVSSDRDIADLLPASMDWTCLPLTNTQIGIPRAFPYASTPKIKHKRENQPTPQLQTICPPLHWQNSRIINSGSKPINGGDRINQLAYLINHLS